MVISVARATASGLTLASAPILSRTLGPEGRGETAAVTAAFLLVPILLSVGVPVEIRRLYVGNGAEALRGARVFSLCMLPITCALAVVLTPLLYRSLTGAPFAIATVGIALSPLTISWLCDQGYLLAASRYRAVALLQIAQPVVYVVAVLGLAMAGQLSVSSALAAGLLGTLATTVLGFLLTAEAGVRGNRVRLRKLLRGGSRFAGNSAAEAASSRLDQVIALPLIGANQSGFYAVAVTIASIPITIAHALGASYFNAIVAARSPAEKYELRIEALRCSLGIGLLASLVLSALAPLLVPVVFGQEFARAVPATLISLLGSAFLIAGYVASMCMAADGRGWQMTAGQVGSLALGLLCLFGLGPWLGAVGAAMASTTSYIALYLMLFRLAGAPWSSIGFSIADIHVGIRRVLSPA